MWEFNLVATLDSGGSFIHLIRELELYGDFRKTEFLGVILGQVEDPAAFLEMVLQKRAGQMTAFQDLGRLLPVERIFHFTLENFVEGACEAVRPYVAQLPGKRFYVRLERRGFKGRIVSPEAEKAIDAFIENELAESGQTAHIDFEHPDAVIVVETIGDRCGVGLLTRQMLERYDFVRVG